MASKRPDDGVPIPAGLHNLRLDPELKDICRESGLRLAGRKSELLGRIIVGWQDGSPQVRDAVRRALGISAPAAQGSVPLTIRLNPGGPSGAGGDSSSSQPQELQRVGNQCGPLDAPPLRLNPDAPGYNPAPPLKNCLCAVSPIIRVPPPYAAQVKCSECGSRMHTACMSIPTPEANQTNYVCVLCRAMWLDPFATAVMGQCVDGRVGDPHWCFAQQQHFIPAASQISIMHGHPPNVRHVDFDVGQAVHQRIMAGGMRLEVRCFLGNPPYHRLNHRWPLRSRVDANNINCSALQQAAQAWDGHAYKDRNEDKPLVVPRNLLRVGRNKITITSFDPQGHILVLALTETRTPNAVVEQVKRDKTMPYSVAHQHMKASFGEWDEDDDLVPGPAVLPLTCPLTMTRLTTPARGQKCRHLECFDLNAYIELARTTQHPRWTCPLCNGPARPHQLQVDSWVMDVLEKSPSDRLEVEVQPDGQFGAVPERPPPGSGNSARKRKAAAAAALELDDDDEAAPSAIAAGAAAAAAAAAGIPAMRSGLGAAASASALSGGNAGGGGGVTTAPAYRSLGGAGSSSTSGSGTATPGSTQVQAAPLPPPPPPQPQPQPSQEIDMIAGDDADHPIELDSDDD